MRRFLDTSILIDHLRGHPEAVALLVDAVNLGDELWGSVVTRTEVIAGMRPKEKAPTMALLGCIHWQDVTLEISDLSGELAQRFIKSHPGVDTVDYIIAASAKLLNATLWTMNLKHFPMFKGLKAPY